MWHRVIAIIVVIICAFGMSKLSIGTDYRLFFSEQNPDFLALADLERKFGKQDFALIAVSNLEQGILSEETLEIKETLVKELRNTPHLISIESISSELNGTDAGLLSGNTQKSKKTLQSYYGSLINPTHTSLGVVVKVNMPHHLPNAVVESARFIEQVIETFSLRHEEYRFDTSGIVMMNYAFAKHLVEDLMLYVPLSNALLFLLIAWFFRSFWVAGSVLIISGLSTITAMGFGALAGIQLTPPSGMSATIILTLSVATAFHFLNAANTVDGKLSEQLKASLGKTKKPIFIACMTTVLGFLSLNLSTSPPYQDLGNMTAVGVFSLMYLMMTLFPWLLSKHKQKISHRFNFDWKCYVALIEQYKKWGVVLGSLLIVFSLIAASKLDTNDQFTSWFSKNTQFRQSTDFISNNLTGLYYIDFVLSSKRTQTEAVQFLKEIDKITTELQGWDNVWAVQIGAGSEKLSQRLRLVFKAADSNYILWAEKEVINFIYKNTKFIDVSKGVGAPKMFANLTLSNISNMVLGFVFMVLILAIVFVIYMRNVGLSALAILANVAPVVIALGFWSILSPSIGLAVSIVAVCSLGMIVDDTTHFLSHFQRPLSENDYKERIVETLNLTGNAILQTTIVLTLGFGVFLTSGFLLNSVFAQFTILVLWSALIFDLLILPCILLVNSKRRVSC